MNPEMLEAFRNFTENKSTENWFIMRKLSKDFGGIKEINCPKCKAQRKWKYTGISAGMTPTRNCKACRVEEKNRLSPEEEDIVNMFNR